MNLKGVSVVGGMSKVAEITEKECTKPTGIILPKPEAPEFKPKSLEAWTPEERRLRQPLLNKLLEKEVRMEHSRILQVVRFVVDNDYLLAHPYRPLQFFQWIDKNGNA